MPELVDLIRMTADDMGDDVEYVANYAWKLGAKGCVAIISTRASCNQLVADVIKELGDKMSSESRMWRDDVVGSDQEYAVSKDAFHSGVDELIDFDLNEFNDNRIAMYWCDLEDEGLYFDEGPAEEVDALTAMARDDGLNH